MKNDIYRYFDNVVEHLSGCYVNEFNKYRNIGKFDAINVITKSKSLYRKLYKRTYDAYYTMANQIYHDYTGDSISKPFVTEILESYEAVTQYIFKNEWERKRARFAESMIASKDKHLSYALALRLLTKQGLQGIITVADAAQREAFKELGVAKVRWIAEEDEKTCMVCHKRDGHVYSIDNVPTKPHYNCRCYLEAVTEDKK